MNRRIRTLAPKALGLSGVRMLSGLFLLGAVGCASQKSATDDPDHPADAPRPSDSVLAAGENSAEVAFLEEAKRLEPSVKSGKPDWGEVADRMEAVVEKHPDYGLGWYNLGLAQERNGQEGEAENSYRRAMSTDGPREAWENLAAMYQRAGNEREARRILEELVNKDIGAAHARVALAELMMAEGLVKDAVRFSREALSREPKNLRAYCVLAQAAFLAKDFARTRLIISQGYKIDKDAACLHFTLAKVHLAKKRVAEALLELERVAKAEPKRLEARFRIAEISMGYKDYRKAIANYRAITEVDPNNAAAFVNMGVALKGANQFAEAEKAYLKAIEVAKDAAPANAHFNLGVLYLRNMSRLDDAQTQLKRYLQVASDSGSDDPAFKMIEEIEQMKAMEEEMKRMEAEQKRQEEIDAKAAAEEKRRQEEEAARQKAIEEKAKEKAADEPGDPGAPPPPKSGKAEPGDPS